MNISLFDLGASIPAYTVACAIGAVAILALFDVQRTPRWWLCAGLVIVLGALAIDYVAGRSLVQQPHWLLFTATWLAVTTMGAITVPLLSAREGWRSRVVVVFGVLAGGGISAIIGLFIAMSVLGRVYCSSHAECGFPIPM